MAIKANLSKKIGLTGVLLGIVLYMTGCAPFLNGMRAQGYEDAYYFHALEQMERTQHEVDQALLYAELSQMARDRGYN